MSKDNQLDQESVLLMALATLTVLCILFFQRECDQHLEDIDCLAACADNGAKVECLKVCRGEP